MRRRLKFWLAGAGALGAAWCAQAANEDFVEDAAFPQTVAIAFDGASATVSNGAGAGVTFVQDGANLALASTVEGVEFILSGSTAAGSFKLSNAYPAKVTLNGLSLASTNNPAIQIRSTNRCFVVVARGTANFLADGSAYADSAAAGTLYGAGPLVFSGPGSLTVAGRGSKKNGIYSEGYIRMRDGDVAVAGAAKDGVHAVRYFRMDNGTLAITSGGDGIDGDAGYVEINGGAIHVNSPSNDVKGIKCDGNLTVNGGNLTVTHTGIAGKGLSADGNIDVNGGTLDLYTSGGNSATYTNDLGVLDTAAADCLKADGILRILGGTIRAVSTGAAGDAISADGEAIIGVAGITNVPLIEAATRGLRVYLYGSGDSTEYSNPKTFSAQGNVTVNGGTFRATTLNNGGEGLESKNVLTINGGNLDVTCYDDCLNAASNVVINGGLIYCFSTGNDAIDSNGPMAINGGTIVASGTTAPEEGFDCDQNTFAIRGGTLVGTGGASSTPTAASCTQRSVLYGSTGTSGTVVQVKSAGGNALVYKVPRTYSGGGGGPGGGTASMTMLFSVPGLTNGVTYSIVTGGTATGGTEFHGLYAGATVTGGTTSKTFTASTMVTTVN